MKRWGSMSALALAAALLLAGCGGDCGLQDGEDTTVETLRAINTPLALLESHEVVTVNRRYTDADGNVYYTGKVQYTRDADGRLVSWAHYNYDTDRYEVSANERWTQYNGEMYLQTWDEERAMLTGSPQKQYEEYALADLPMIADLAKGAEETETALGTKNGVLQISAETHDPTLEGYYEEILYSADPTTGELLSMVVTSHSVNAEGQESVDISTYEWSYDEPYEPERDLAGEALHESDSADTCLLTLVYAPGTANEETQRYRVTRGSYAMFACRTGSTIYSDAGLSQEIDYQAGIDTSGEHAEAYIVPLEENR